MNEEELFAAYAALTPSERFAKYSAHRVLVRDPDPVESAARVDDRLLDQGKVKCLVESCMTEIAAHTNRQYCRFHVKKLKEAKGFP